MSKAMLIMDMPSCCLECCLFYNEGEIQMCEGLGRIVERKNKRIRQEWCPLREVPMERIVERLEEEKIEMYKEWLKSSHLQDKGEYLAYKHATEICKEEGGIE